MSRITYNHLNLPHTISGTISNVYDAAGKKWQSTQAGVTTTHFGDIEYERPIHDDRSDDVGQCVKGVNPPLAGRVAAIKAIYHQDGERTRSSHTKWLVGEVKRNVRTAVKRGAAMESKHFVRQPKCFCGRILNNNSSYEYQYYIKDHTPRRTCLGNVRIVCNSAAVIQSEQHYYPFGLNMEGNFTATGYNQKYRYNGKDLYGGLGWYDYGARYYDPAVGRFTGVDPLADEPEQVDKSPYAAMWNNPIKYNDPDGRCPNCITALLGGLVEGGIELGSQLLSGKSISDVDWADVGVEFLQGAAKGSGVGLLASGAVEVVGTLAKASTDVTYNGGTQTVFNGSKSKTSAALDVVVDVAGKAAGKRITSSSKSAVASTTKAVEQSNKALRKAENTFNKVTDGGKNAYGSKATTATQKLADAKSNAKGAAEQYTVTKATNKAVNSAAGKVAGKTAETTFGDKVKSLFGF